MDIATMMAMNNLSLMSAQIARTNSLINMMNAEGEVLEMSGSMLDDYFGKECLVSLFNEIGAIKGILKDADAQWIKIDTPKKGVQLVNRNMVRNITFEMKK